MLPSVVNRPILPKNVSSEFKSEHKKVGKPGHYLTIARQLLKITFKIMTNHKVKQHTKIKIHILSKENTKEIQ